MSSLTSSRTRDPAFQAYVLLRATFVLAPILFGLDKFTNWMTEWTAYLAPWIADLSPWSAGTTMKIVGVIEVVAAIVVLVAPQIGGYVVAAWLAGIIINLLSLQNFYDVALRDFGLLMAALALARLAQVYGPPRFSWGTHAQPQKVTASQESALSR